MDVEALFFDVFGTVVDWRTSITSQMEDQLPRSLQEMSSGTIQADSVRSMTA